MVELRWSSSDGRPPSPPRDGFPASRLQVSEPSGPEQYWGSPKVVRGSPNRFAIETSRLLCESSARPSFRKYLPPLKPPPPPARRKGMLLLSCDGGSASSEPKKTTLS